VTLTATKDLVRVADQYEKGLAAGTIVSREAPPGLYALVRPPGHHAQSDLCGGYCFLNNVGIAAQWLIDRPELRHKDGRPKKVAIIDIDFHQYVRQAIFFFFFSCPSSELIYRKLTFLFIFFFFFLHFAFCILHFSGNGTQELFYATSNPLYASLHGRDAYPHFTGAATERGEGEGLGFNINVPLPRSTSDDEYVEALEKLIQEHIIPYDSDYIIISLGVDTFKDDPIAGFLVTSEAYPRIGNAIRKIGLPTLFVQEGGYCVEKLGLNVGGILQGFLGKVAA